MGLGSTTLSLDQLKTSPQGGSNMSVAFPGFLNSVSEVKEALSTRHLTRTTEISCMFCEFL